MVGEITSFSRMKGLFDDIRFFLYRRGNGLSKFVMGVLQRYVKNNKDRKSDL